MSGSTVERPGDPHAEAEERVEFAAGRTGGSSSAFPLEWGVPPGRDGQDPERRRWILEHANPGQGVLALRELAKRDGALVVAYEAALLRQRR